MGIKGVEVCWYYMPTEIKAPDDEVFGPCFVLRHHGSDHTLGIVYEDDEGTFQSRHYDYAGQLLSRAEYKNGIEARNEVYREVKRVVGEWPDSLEPRGFNPTPTERWSQGIPHNERSEEFLEALEVQNRKCDWNMRMDLRSGGDGDPGETLLYLLDMHFHDQEQEDFT